MRRPRRRSARAGQRRRARPGSAGLASKRGERTSSALAGHAALLLVLTALRVEVVRRRTGLGDERAGRAGRLLLLGRHLTQRLDELVDARVARLVDLELVAPGLYRDRPVQAGERAHQREVVAADLLGQRLDIA